MNRKSTRSSEIPPERTSNEMNNSEGRLGIEDILEIDPWKEMEKFETEQVGLIQGIINEFSEKMRIDSERKRKSNGKRRVSSGPMINKASSGSVGIGAMQKSVERESIDKGSNNYSENVEKASSTSNNCEQQVKIDNEKRKISSTISENGAMIKKSVEREPIDKRLMINKASDGFIGIGAKKKSLERKTSNQEPNNNSESISSDDGQPITAEEPKTIMMEKRISETIKIDGKKKRKSSEKCRVSPESINKASSNYVGNDTKKISFEREPIYKGPIDHEENSEKSSSSISGDEEQSISADEPKMITKRNKIDTTKKSTTDRPVIESNLNPMSENTSITENVKSLSKTTEKSIGKNVADHISSIDREGIIRSENNFNGSERNKAMSSESKNKNRKPNDEKITSIVKSPLGQHCKQEIGLLNDKKSKSYENMKNRKRADKMLAKAFEKFGQKFARVSHKMGFRAERQTEQDESSSGSDADESSNCSSSSSSTSSTSSSYSSSSCDCTDCSLGSSCSCSFCCSDDDFTEYTLTSSSD